MTFVQDAVADQVSKTDRLWKYAFMQQNSKGIFWFPLPLYPINVKRSFHKDAVLSTPEGAERRVLLFAVMSGDYCCALMQRGMREFLTEKRKRKLQQL